MLSLAENPPILLPEVESLTELRGLWWLAYTRPRFEKAFAWDLYNHGIGYFLPMYEKTIFSGGRNRRLMMPLFTSYVFFCGTEQDRYAAMRTNRLCHTVNVADQQRLIDELADIEAALLSRAVIASYPSLAAGRRCRVTSGPMKDIEGVIVERKCPRARMVIEVSILTQGALVEIDADLLEPL
jgi:transcription antitermination factor NusG